MTDYKQLCADLLRELDHASAWDYQQALKDQARAALAERQPEVVGPSDEDLDLLVIAIQALRPEPSPNSHDLATVDRGREILRAWLSRHGRPAPAPTTEPQP